MSFSNIIHDSEYYTSNIATAVNSGGLLFAAAVINDTKSGQYCVIHRIDTNTKENKETARLWKCIYIHKRYKQATMGNIERKSSIVTLKP